MIQNHRDLIVWQKGIFIVLTTYRLCAEFPTEERFVLSAQMRRAAISVVSNIAEGQARKSPRAFVYFLSIALGSLAELDTHLEVAVRLGYVSRAATFELADLIGIEQRLLFGLRRAQNRRLVWTSTAPKLLILLSLGLTVLARLVLRG